MKASNPHKMLEKCRLPIKVKDALFEATWLLIILTLAAGTFTWNHQSVFFGGEVYFADGDCYARMTRVRMIEQTGLHSIRHHSFENFPLGTTPHTTMPLDALIFGLSKILRAFSSDPLPLAGALISPLLGLATLLFLAAWSAALRLPYRRAMLLMAAVSPIIAQGFQIGRPDHQSLLMLLLAIALASEAGVIQTYKRFWTFAAATAWALALWVSLFEPAILLALVLAARGIYEIASYRRRKSEPQAVPATPWHRHPALAPVAVFFAILGLAFWIDGWRSATFDPAFKKWSLNIGELFAPAPETLFSWCGWLLIAAPILLAWKFLKDGKAIHLGWLALIASTTALTLQHARWGYFLALFFAMSLPWLLPTTRKRWIIWSLVIASLWPIAAEWERLLFPDDQAFHARAEQVADAVALREAALTLKLLPSGGVLAPWWFCPAIVWWSVQPCIGGSSHQSLPGIVDSCEFYLSESLDAASSILRKRKISYVIAYEPDRVISNSAQIVDRAPPVEPLAINLYKHPSKNSPLLRYIHGNTFFRVFEVNAD